MLSSDIVVHFVNQFVSHASEHQHQRYHLVDVEVVIEGVDADQHRQHFSAGGNQREHVLFEVDHDEIDGKLSDDRQQRGE